MSHYEIAWDVTLQQELIVDSRAGVTVRDGIRKINLVKQHYAQLFLKISLITKAEMHPVHCTVKVKPRNELLE
jgi:hypothetical protein